MWLAVDRIERDTVVMIADDETVFHLDVNAYERLTGIPPQETHTVWCEIKDHEIISARIDPSETARRTKAAQDRLRRLLDKNNHKG